MSAYMRERTCDESGLIGIAVAIVVSTVLILMGVFVVNAATFNQSDTTFRGEQVQALNAAEAGLNHSYEVIEDAIAAGNALPCYNLTTNNALKETLSTPSGSSSPPSSYKAFIAYYSSVPTMGSFPPQGSLICTQGSGPSSVPAYAEILSGGTDFQTTEYMEGQVQIASDLFTDALFTGGTLTINNNNNNVNSASDTGNVYAGAFKCSGTTTIQGTLDVSGAFQESGGCSGLARGSTAVQTIPQIDEPSGGFISSSSWPTVTTDNNCNDFSSLLPAYSGNTIIMTSCQIKVTNNLTVPMQPNTNVAIYSTGGFNMSGSVALASNSGTSLLYLIVPTEVGVLPTVCLGGSPGIAINGGLTASNVDVMLYTPCNVTVTNAAPVDGQIYGGGNVTTNNGLQITFVSLANPPGASGSGGNPAGTSVVYERQCASSTGC